MINVYIDPFSYSVLSNKLFSKSSSYYYPEGMENSIYLKKYCSERNINLNTIDFWSENKKTPDDIYVSFEHKNLLRKIYWRLKNKDYPFLKLSHFKKRILFNGEPPTVLPEAYKNIDSLFKIYDEVYFSCKVDDPRCHYFHAGHPYDGVLLNYWNNFETSVFDSYFILKNIILD